MKVEQIATIANQISKEVVGEQAIQTVDLSNVVDMGNEIFDTKNVENYVKKLIDHIGKVVFVNRPYSGSAPSVLMDGWEYGSVLEKISMGAMPEAVENDSWKLTNGTSYDPNIFNGPTVNAKFYDSKNTFEIQMSFAERQVKSAFDNATQLNAFFSMIETSINNSMTIKLDQLIMDTICNMIGWTIKKGTDGLTKVNVLSMYNAQFGTTLAADKALTTPEFIRYASLVIKQYISRIKKLSVLFNIGKQERFTPQDRMHLIMLDSLKSASDVYLQSDVYHNELTQLPASEGVTFWQGSGTSYTFNDISKVMVTIPSGDSGAKEAVEQTGILAVMFDRDALGVCNVDQRVTTNYNPRAEFYNNWYKFDAGYFNDTNENFIVFYAA